ncbi:uncharacterized protein LOC130653626 [Hydractinia symbiolongicarpus]|nr:uncharacterized protein LOC130648184 [Hydractinia symbiolongicarpus]XP_057311882.1 uncharacterized protein LOC130649591 isoform X1 [Hydractinia symbiolongicarpus]XP_057312137.1 uncharacterized protein LOC130653626 [Hydractinia symbiolongicarpus]
MGEIELDFEMDDLENNIMEEDETIIKLKKELWNMQECRRKESIEQEKSLVTLKKEIDLLKEGRDKEIADHADALRQMKKEMRSLKEEKRRERKCHYTFLLDKMKTHDYKLMCVHH